MIAPSPRVTSDFAITTVSPPGYIHSQAFREIAEGLHFSLRRMGHNSALTTVLANRIGRQIVLGAHLIPKFSLEGMARDAVIFNFEQVDRTSNWIDEAYLNLLRDHEVWDYSAKNIGLLRSHGVADIHHVPLGYVPELDRIRPRQQDIDVLFYGSMNPRRQATIDALKSAGLSVCHIYGVYGAKRDDLIARAKIVLNLHYYETKIFEIARVSYLLINGVCVVSETGLDPGENEYCDAVAFASYDDLTGRCLELVHDPARRQDIAARGHSFMQRQPQERFLQHVIPSTTPMPQAKTTPGVLNLGSGKDFRIDALNVDISREWNPDIVFDFNTPLPPEGITLPSARFGPVTLGENQFDRICSYDVLEHLRDLTTAMTTCLRLLKTDGVFEINVPYDLSYGAWQDPTHVRAFNERSWLYYTDWFWYLGWDRWRFDLLSLSFNLSPIGEQMQRENIPLDIIARAPRAVDSMQVQLKKRALTPDELAVAQRYRLKAR